MSKKNLLVLALALVLIPTSAFAATTPESVMTIEIIHVQIAFIFACLIAVRFLFEDWMQNRKIKALTAEIANLKTTAALNAEAHKETRRDATEAWEEVETLLAKVQRLQNRLNVTTDDLIEAEANLHNTSAALVKEQDKNYQLVREVENLNSDVQWNKDQAVSMANLANNNAKLANALMQKL